MTKNKTIKKQKRIKQLKLRYSLPLIAILLVLLGIGFESLGLGVSCQGGLICLGPGSLISILVILPGMFFLYPFGIEPFAASEGNDILLNSILIIVNLLFYFLLGFLIEKLTLKFSK